MLEVARGAWLEVGRREALEVAVRLARESLFDLLASGDLSPTADERARIAEERALEQIHEWLRRTPRAKSISEVLGA